MQLALTLGVALVILVPTTALAVPTRTLQDHPGLADHLGGSFSACGPLLEYTAPTAVTDGSLQMVGVSLPDPHDFVIAAGTAVDPGTDALLAALAGSDGYTCLDLVGDGMAVITSVAIAASAELCGPLSLNAGDEYVLADADRPGELTVTLTGEAAALVAADPALDNFLAATIFAGDETMCLTLTTDGTGALDTLTLAGTLNYCAEVIDNHPDPGVSILFHYPNDQPVPDPTLQLTMIDFDSSLFSETALGFLELAYWAHHPPFFDGVAAACVAVVVVDSAVASISLDPSFVRLCGTGGFGSRTVGLSFEGEFALAHEELIGTRFPAEDHANLIQLLYLIQDSGLHDDELCLNVSIQGGVDDTEATVFAEADACLLIDEPVGDTVRVALNADPNNSVTFSLASPGSSLDVAGEFGDPAGSHIEVASGVDGALVITPLALAGCAGTSAPPQLPDSATEGSGPHWPVAAFIPITLAVLLGGVRLRRHIAH